MTAKIKRAVRLRIREAEMLERIRPPFLIGAARGILEFFHCSLCALRKCKMHAWKCKTIHVEKIFLFSTINTYRYLGGKMR